MAYGTSLKAGHSNPTNHVSWATRERALDAQKKGKGYYARYRCCGECPRRQGCGAPVVNLNAVDSLVLGASEHWDEREYVTDRYVADNDQGVRLVQSWPIPSSSSPPPTSRE